MTQFTQDAENPVGMNLDMLQSISTGSANLSESLSTIISNSADCDAKLTSADRATGAYTIILQGTLNEEGKVPEKAA